MTASDRCYQVATGGANFFGELALSSGALKGR